MKKLTLLYLLVIAALFSACKKDKDKQTNKADYYVLGKKNNVAWRADNPYTSQISQPPNDSLVVFAHIGEETLVISCKRPNANTYPAGGYNASYYTTVGQDVIVSKYKLSNDPSNTLLLYNYNEAKNLVEGTFNLTFERVYGGSGYPDKIVFTGGVLRAPVFAKIAL